MCVACLCVRSPKSLILFVSIKNKKVYDEKELNKNVTKSFVTYLFCIVFLQYIFIIASAFVL